MKELCCSLNFFVEFREKHHQFRFSMVKSCYWCKRDIKVQPVLPEILIFSQSIKHLRGTLRVADISNLIDPSLLPDIINLSRGIMLPHLREGEFPVSFVFFIIQGHMANAVFGSSLVS